MNTDVTAGGTELGSATAEASKGAERLAVASTHLQALRAALSSALMGQAAVVEQALWGLLARGHVLLEGAPGLGKTLLVRALTESLALQYSRIQFTPDLMPSDITGSEVLALDDHGHSSGKVVLRKGPIFCQILLADEINRASPKTQSALLEAMQEGSVTIGGKKHTLAQPFMVFATQNPLEMEGTYPLPEAQLDRFMLKIAVEPPELEQFEQILAETTTARAALSCVLDHAALSELQSLCEQVVVPRAVVRYAARLCTATRPDAKESPTLVQRNVRLGVSVRAGQALLRAAKARALSAGNAHVAFEDVAAVAQPALRHRLLLNFEAQAALLRPEQVVAAVLEHVDPRASISPR